MTLKTNNLEQLLDKYKGYAFMYAQYPNQGVWSREFGEDDFINALKEMPTYFPNSPSMLYVHFPYCPTLCTYCTCFKIIKNDYSKVDDHFPYLLENIKLLKSFYAENSIKPEIKNVHLGGGSPTYLNDDDFLRLVNGINELVKIEDLVEFNLEIDPRQATVERLLYFSELGINRISFGIQDFDSKVMEAVNRVQPPKLMRDLLTPEIRKQFPSIHFDFLLGLPKQTVKSFMDTLEIVLELAPDRMELCTYNHMPERFSHQRNLINENDLPSTLEISEMFSKSAEKLLANGYERVGLEHFAKPSDGLTKMYNDGSCNWNMTGYSQGDGNKIIGVGLGATSRITDNYYFENIKTLKEYKDSIDQGKFPINRGWKLSHDDLIRREVTVNLRSGLYLNFKSIEERFGIEFKEYFRKELVSLTDFVEDGVITFGDDEITFTEIGKPFAAFVCMKFDAYYQNG
jgi:oxygen-independent coproporphyrinogen-3 oxidase